MQCLWNTSRYEKFRQDRIKKKIEQERQSRISVIKKLPKINAKEALRILSRQKEGQGQEVDQGTDGNPRTKKKTFIANPLCDPRFKAMFEDEDFIVDTGSKEYMELHPNEGRKWLVHSNRYRVTYAPVCNFS